MGAAAGGGSTVAAATAAASAGCLLLVPRPTWRQWGLTGLPACASSNVAEELNRAYANHEIVGDYLTACLAWFEAGGSLPLSGLVQQVLACAWFWVGIQVSLARWALNAQRPASFQS